MELMKYRDEYKEDVVNYFLTDEMTYFTGTPQENIAISQKNPQHHPILAFSQQKLVTFLFWMQDPKKQTIRMKMTLFCCGVSLLMRDF